MKFNFLPQSKLFLVLFFVFIFSILIVEGAYYWLRVKKEPTPPKPEVGEYVTLENLWTYVEPDENTKRGYLIPGRTFKIVEEKGEWAKIEVYEPHFDMTWDGWIKTSDPGYQPKE